MLDQGPVQLLVVRVAGKIVNPDLLSSMGYGDQFLGVPLVVVLGHTSCSAVESARKILEKQAILPGHLPGVIQTIKPV